jgi:hypothetical protein
VLFISFPLANPAPAVYLVPQSEIMVHNESFEDTNRTSFNGTNADGGPPLDEWRIYREISWVLLCLLGRVLWFFRHFLIVLFLWILLVHFLKSKGFFRTESWNNVQEFWNNFKKAARNMHTHAVGYYDSLRSVGTLTEHFGLFFWNFGSMIYNGLCAFAFVGLAIIEFLSGQQPSVEDNQEDEPDQRVATENSSNEERKKYTCDQYVQEMMEKKKKTSNAPRRSSSARSKSTSDKDAEIQPEPNNQERHCSDLEKVASLLVQLQTEDLAEVMEKVRAKKREQCAAEDTESSEETEVKASSAGAKRKSGSI